VIVDPYIHARRIECEDDGLYFARYFWKQRHGTKMLISQHHGVMQDTFERVYAGEIRRLIVTLPPGYSKTELALINFTARGLAKYPHSRFMHLTYSDTLARQSSSFTRTLVTSPAYQAMWPTKIRNDTNAKNLWWTDQDGGVFASTPEGQVTGFRAGYMERGIFSGALLLDDPMKPLDALSKGVRDSINSNYGETIASRVAIEDIPVVLIMQRLDYDDMAGFLLRGGSGEMWHHLDMPVIIDNAAPYPAENTHGIPIVHGLPDGWLWPFKHNAEHLTALKAHKRKWGAQYLQRPPRFDAEGALWSQADIDGARNMDRPWAVKRTVVAIDPGISSNPGSDLTGIIGASAYTDGKYAVRADASLRAKPEGWALAAIQLYNALDADAIVVEVNQGGEMCESTLRQCIDPRTGQKFRGRVIKMHASRGKHIRAEPVQVMYAMGEVYHDADADLTEYETELLEFVPSPKKSPNRMDAGVYALSELTGKGVGAAVW
tara:strand:- start:92 stop:1561 length:1470 start_codon:yes stop_codon:yes gene_type:complete